MSVENQFQKFYENIKLTSLQREDAVKKYKGVCKKLHNHYYPDIKYNGKTKLLVGSYGKKTHIRPARDIDVIFIMPQEKYDKYSDNTSNCQSQLLQDIKKILEEKYSSIDIKAFGKVVVVSFSDTKHKVEVIPAWENDSGVFIIPNSENGGYWENCDYRKGIKAVNESEAETGRTRMLIRMVKKWSDNCTAKVKSFQIEQAVLSFFSGNSQKEKTCAVLIRDFFNYFSNSVYDEGLKNHLNTAIRRSVKACDFENDGDLKNSVIEWQKIFGLDFPITLEKDISSTTLEDQLTILYKNYPSHKEEYLDSKYGIITNINPEYKFKINADVEQDGFRIHSLSYFLLNRIYLKKYKKLVFKITKNSVPEPFQVKWKVRNFGEEAHKSDDLRGEISDDGGSRIKAENTKYAGEHYVECYIIKDNICVAMARIFVPIGTN